MPAIEVVADLQALNKWASEAQIASEAEDPRRAPHSARSPKSEDRSNFLEDHRTSVGSSDAANSRSLEPRKGSKEGRHLSTGGVSTVSRASTRHESADLLVPISRSSSRHATGESATTISRSGSRHATGELPSTLSRSSSRHATGELPAASRSSSRHATGELPAVSRSSSRQPTGELPTAISRSSSRHATGELPMAISRSSSRHLTGELAATVTHYEHPASLRATAESLALHVGLTSEQPAATELLVSTTHFGSQKPTSELSGTPSRPGSRKATSELPGTISRSGSRKATSELPGTISRSGSRKATSELPGTISRSGSRKATSELPGFSQTPALMDIDEGPLAGLPKLLRQISVTTDNESTGMELALFEESKSLATSTYAHDQLVLVPSTASRPSPKTQKMKSDLLRSHPWLQELQRAAQSGSLPSSPVGHGAFLRSPQASSAPNLPPLENLQLQLHDGHKMEVDAYATPRQPSHNSKDILSTPFTRKQTWNSKDEMELLNAGAGEEHKTGILPPSIRKLDYWRAIELFHLFDRRTGELDKLGFYHLLTAASRDKEEIPRVQSDNIFNEIDMDGSGNIDKEEFLGWVFQTNSSFLSSVRRKLEVMPEAKVKALFEQMDKDENGCIDKEEFWNFVEKFSPGMLSRQASDELHEFIDADRSGGIDGEEFLNWIHPGRELHLLKAEVSDELTGKVAAGIINGTYTAPKKPLMETEPGKPVVLQFWIGDEWISNFKALKRSLRAVFSSQQIQFDLQRDSRVMNTCSKLVAKVGRGIILWDRDRMLAFKDDPFMNQITAQNWIKDVLLQCLPDVINAANVRLLKRKKQNVCFECGRTLEGARYMLVLEYKVCSKHCSTLLKARAVP
ncbi:unnamed protein product [Durusdinium trenchii]|uniref:EF-hand domain-containing protein n=1 Tax=Durusdinium trenchii TaxID=1381693 RepID=A0ABP0PVM4_9DINO